MAKLSVMEGGCWYCDQDEEHEGLLFSWEFDCGVHASCLTKVYSNNPDDLEAEIMFCELMV